MDRISLKKRNLLYALAVFVLTALLTVYFVVSYIPSQSVLCLNGEPLIPLTQQSVKAYTKKASKHPYLYFKFTQNETSYLEKKVINNNGASVKIRLQLLDTSKEHGQFAFGFLYEDDFTKKNKLKSSISINNFATFDYDAVDGQYLDVSMCVSKQSFIDKNLPCGIVVYGNSNYSVDAISVNAPVVGFDKSNEIKYYAFDKDGGSAKDLFSLCDFTNAASYFDRANINIGFEPINDIGTYDNQYRVNFTYGGENFGIRRAKTVRKMVLPTSAFNKGFSNFDITSNKNMVNALYITADRDMENSAVQSEILTPLSIDLGMVLSYPQNNWRCQDYELYEWQLIPNVLFFDFKNYKIQNQFLTRLAYFVEKEGYRGTLVSDYYVENMHGYNAHDYKANDLAAFFTKAYLDDFPLNENEKKLCRILVKNGIIVENNDGTYSEGNGAVISISRESPDYLRAQLMSHESWHGIYFTDEEFRNTVSAVYYMFDSVCMDFLKTFWKTQPGLGYDTSDDYLVQNEFMAYIMQQSLANTPGYFVKITNRGSVMQNQKEQADYVRSSKAQAFYDACAVLNDYAFDRWGLAAGRVSLFIRY